MMPLDVTDMIIVCSSKAGATRAIQWRFPILCRSVSVIVEKTRAFSFEHSYLQCKTAKHGEPAKSRFSLKVTDEPF
jgi:hypothetical protein